MAVDIWNMRDASLADFIFPFIEQTGYDEMFYQPAGTEGANLDLSMMSTVYQTDDQVGTDQCTNYLGESGSCLDMGASYTYDEPYGDYGEIGLGGFGMETDPDLSNRIMSGEYDDWLGEDANYIKDQLAAGENITPHGMGVDPAQWMAMNYGSYFSEYDPTQEEYIRQDMESDYGETARQVAAKTGGSAEGYSDIVQKTGNIERASKFQDVANLRDAWLTGTYGTIQDVMVDTGVLEPVLWGPNVGEDASEWTGDWESEYLYGQ